MRIKPAYAGLRCGRCGRYDSDKVFDVGFDGEVSLKIKGDYGHTTDRIFIIRDSFLHVLKTAGIGGYETKPIGATGWHALRVTLRVDSNDTVIKTSGEPCGECGRPEESWGLHLRLSDLDLPKTTNTLFTTKHGWPSAPFFDRSIFISEEIAKILKDSGIRGGYGKRLLTDDEWNWVESFRNRGIPKEVPGITIYLSGVRLKSSGRLAGSS